MAKGTLIAESLQIGSPLDAVPLNVTEIRRRSFDGLPPDQPAVWTFVEFTIDDDHTAELSTALAEALDEVGGWYCDFHTTKETIVVFPRKVFRYPRGDLHQRADAAAHARTIDIPENQIDWPD